MSADLRSRMKQAESDIAVLKRHVAELSGTTIEELTPEPVTGGARTNIEAVVADENTVTLLRAGGISFLDEVESRTDDQLKALDGIGDARVKAIRNDVKKYKATDGSKK